MYIHSFCSKVVTDAIWAWLCSMGLDACIRWAGLCIFHRYLVQTCAIVTQYMLAGLGCVLWVGILTFPREFVYIHRLFFSKVVADVSWAWICSMGLDYGHFPEKLYIHGFSCYSCLPGLDMFDGLDYRHFPENLYTQHSSIRLVGMPHDWSKTEGYKRNVRVCSHSHSQVKEIWRYPWMSRDLFPLLRKTTHHQNK